MPRILEESGLVNGLEVLLDNSFVNTGVEVGFEHFGVAGKRYEASLEIAIYRSIQELINNIIKHSKATKVNVQLFPAQDSLVLIVEDNGIGFKTDQANKKGTGLLNIQSRISTLNGELRIEPGPKKGTVATLRAPLL